jgi:hypothetical protein
MRNEQNQDYPDSPHAYDQREDEHEPQNVSSESVSSGSFTMTMNEPGKFSPHAVDARIKSVKRNRSKHLLLLTVALAATLSICSVRWIMETKTTPVKAVIAVKQQPVVVPPPAPVAEKQVIVEAPQKVSLPKRTVAPPDPGKKFRKNWWQYIKADHSSYAYGVLGGINDLAVVFSNKTDFMMDEVTAKVTYLKANGEPWKTKMITVYNLPPHSDSKQSLSKVNRGKWVEVDLSKIVSKRMHFSYAPGKTSRHVDDPYFMD